MKHKVGDLVKYITPEMQEPDAPSRVLIFPYDYSPKNIGIIVDIIDGSCTEPKCKSEPRQSCTICWGTGYVRSKEKYIVQWGHPPECPNTYHPVQYCDLKKVSP